MKRRNGVYKFLFYAFLLFSPAMISGCGVSAFQQGISDAIMNNPDPETIREAFPTFLVLTDALIEANPNSVDRLRTGAELYSAYAALFVDDPDRARILVKRGRQYGEQALCLDTGFACNLDNVDYKGFIKILNQVKSEKIPSLYAYTISWLSWARYNSDDWSVVANLPKYQVALVHVLQVDEYYRQGSALVYLGMLRTLRPPSLGGRPEEGRAFFERAIKLSQGRNLSASVELANSYARMTYNRELHDQILKEVMLSPTEAPGLTLLNVLAKRQAQSLLESADAYF